MEATDPDLNVGDILTFSLDVSPAGMTADAATGLIRWTPDSTQLGEHVVTARVTDTADLFDTQTFTVVALAVPDLIVDLVDQSSITGDWQTLEVSGTVVATIANQGAGPAVGEFSVSFFEDANLNGVFDSGVDNVLGSAVQNGLAAGDTAAVVGAISGTMLFRGNLIYAFVDSGEVISESDETNNYSNTGVVCTFVPTVGSFDPVVEWHKSTFAVKPTSNQVMMTPAVVDLNDDGVPDVVFSTFIGGGYTANGTLRAINGADGSDLWNLTDPAYEVAGQAGVAVGDIDLDGRPEIIALHESDRLMAVEHDGTFKWMAPNTWGGVRWGSASIADLDQDGTPEIVIGGSVLNNDGTIRWQGNAAGGLGRGDNGVGPLSTVADLDLDGSPEVVAGRSAYRADGSLYWNAAIGDGFPAVADFDDDPFPEIVVVSRGKVYLLEHDGTVKWGPITVPGGGNVGAPTVADMDGDGEPEIGVAGAGRYVVLETDGSVKWQSVTRDFSSNVTGSSVFDFEGDGSAEVIYGDELFLRIYRGTDGTVLYELAKGSGTTYELPVIADVDADGNAEIVAVANNYAFGTVTGILVIGDLNDTWVPTRQIWNQHTYHITNVNDDATIPTVEANNWETFNNFRLNTQTAPGGAHAAPDLTASFLRVAAGDGETLLTARVGNGGAVVVGSGVPVSFYDGNPADGGTLLGTVETTQALQPGQFEDVTLALAEGASTVNTIWVVADDSGGLVGHTNECDEVNNLLDSGLILATLNQPPVITSEPPLTASAGELYLYDVDAQDPNEGDVLSFSLDVAPDGMTIDPGDGVISWTPTNGQLGDNPVTVRVEDQDGLFDTQGFVISVGAVADLAMSKGGDPDPVVAGETLVYTVRVDNLGPSEATVVVVTDDPPATTPFAAILDGGQEVPPVAGSAMGASTFTLNISQTSILSSIAISHFGFALVTIIIIKHFFEPGFEMRNGALLVIASTGDSQVQADAFRVYQHGNFLIALGAALIGITGTITQFTQSFAGLAGSIKSLATAGNLLVGGVQAVGLANDINSLNGKLGDVNQSINGLAQALGQPNVVPPEAKKESKNLTEGLKGFFFFALKLLGSVE